MNDASEFIPEAQELIENYSGRLIEIEGQLRDGNDYDPDLLNGAFRAVHTLKSLASLLDVDQLLVFSHELEDTLDALRKGKLPLDEPTLNLLFESIELFGAMLRGVVEPEAATHVDIEPFLAQLAKLSVAKTPTPDDPDDLLAWLDDSLRGVLTEFEEHRMRENVRLGRRLYRVHASFDLLAIDVGIDALKGELKRFGEVITCLPSAGSTSDDLLDLDFILGSVQSLADIGDGIGEQGATIETLHSNDAAAEPQPQPQPQPQPAAAPTPSTTAPAVDATSDDGQAAEPASGAGAGQSTGQSADDDQLSVRSLSQTVRVDLRRLDHLMKLVGELTLVHTNLDGALGRMLPAEVAHELRRELHDQLRVMNRRLELLQQGILDVRMVPIGQVFSKLERLVRNVAVRLGKDVRLDTSGADTELDKLIVEELSDSLMHMITNAINHGIELPEERLARGKPRVGRLALRAHQKGNRVVIEVIDDGKGMDWQAIRDRAAERGFISREEADSLGPAQALKLIFRHGFSTLNEATKTAGRGVGMDVVKTNIARLSGMIDVSSELGRGSCLRVTLPTTLAIIQALVIQTAGQTFCIPLNSVLESIMVRTEEIETIEGHAVISVRGRTLPILHLSRVFDLELEDSEAQRRSTLDHFYVVVVGLAEHRIGLVVDELLGQQDVVIKPIGRALSQIPGISGATELGDNRTVLLLDVGTLVGEAVGDLEATGAG